MAASFPTDARAFDADDRISFSRLDNKYVAVHDDGSEYEFDSENKRWISTEHDDAIGELSAAAVKRETSTPLAEDGSRRRRRDQSDEVNGDTDRRAPPKKKQKGPPQPKQNTAVYVTGLPSDATINEVNELFSRKAGVIAEEIDSKGPRIKMYTDSKGEFKGDALVVFFKPQSVEMAIMLLDDTDFRWNASGTKEGRMRVQAADASYKKTQYEEQQEEEGKAKKADERRPQRKMEDRQKIIKKTQKMDAKLADWDDDEPYPQPGVNASKWDKTVILTHMFTLEELKEDPAALLDIKEDIREESAKLGTVTNVVLFDKEEDGIVSVKFMDAESAKACIRVMHGRNFDGRKVEAFLATGKEKFERSKEDGDEE